MDGVRHCTAADYRMALLVLASLVIGLLTAFSLRETLWKTGRHKRGIAAF